MTQPSEVGTQNMPTVPTNTAVSRKRGRPIGATSARKTRVLNNVAMDGSVGVQATAKVPTQAQNTVEENMRNVNPPQPRLPSRGRGVTRPNRGRRLNFEGRGVFVAESGFMVENPGTRYQRIIHIPSTRRATSTNNNNNDAFSSQQSSVLNAPGTNNVDGISSIPSIGRESSTIRGSGRGTRGRGRPRGSRVRRGRVAANATPSPSRAYSLRSTTTNAAPSPNRTYTLNAAPNPTHASILPATNARGRGRGRGRGGSRGNGN
ncbi:hypothetical protein Tsubulata_036227 [Turnera subulata]|uniref:Uncharacterized protein n=1 Tax=Turnera subulata TaxID=218843 RepID=A0A9Q0FAE7_9ROSI|nr:hypothetical protein Tsubulata_036227 [Turnera subulata]